MGQEPDAIREEIADTRARMGATVDAISYKADVPARAKESLMERRDAAARSLTKAKDAVVGTVAGGTGQLPSGDQLAGTARRTVGLAQQNPAALALGAVAVGFLAGLALPSSQLEDERIGPISDDVKAQAARTGAQLVEHGKEVAQDVAQSALETARESGQQHAEQAKQAVSEAASNVTGD